MSRIGWLSPGDVPNDTDSDDCEEEMEVSIPEESPQKCFSRYLTLEEYEAQKKSYTKEAVEHLINSPEYQKRHNTCGSCWCNWLINQYSETCMECGGFALTRPCPICHGKCGSQWQREVDLSHSMHEAHWDGQCGLPPEEQEKFLYENIMAGATDDEVLDALEDLSTS